MFLQILICLQAKRNNFYRKSDSLMSLLISGQHIGQFHVAWRPYTKLCKLAWNVSLRTDLRLGYLVYLWVLGNISVSSLLSFNGFKVIFSLRDSETKNYKSFMFKPIWGLCIDITRIMIKPSCWAWAAVIIAGSVTSHTVLTSVLKYFFIDILGALGEWVLANIV